MSVIASRLQQITPDVKLGQGVRIYSFANPARYLKSVRRKEIYASALP